MRCRFYFVTWDAQFPFGCRAFGFKSRIPPYREVYASSGEQCLKFEPRNPE